MAKIKPTSAAVRQAFRRTLNSFQVTTFDQLCKHLNHPRTDLGWYHELGMLLHALIPETVTGRGRILWLQKNAEALGPGTSLLQKAYRFYEEYPQRQDVRGLEAVGTNWTSLYIAFAVKDRDARHKLLAESLEKEWSPKHLRFEVQRRYPSKRQGVGGRPVSKQRAHGPGVALREMERFTGRWLAFHDEAWSKIKPASWKRFVRTWRSDERDTWQQLLRELDHGLEELTKRAQKVRRAVAKLRNRTGMT